MKKTFRYLLIVIFISLANLMFAEGAMPESGFLNQITQEELLYMFGFVVALTIVVAVFSLHNASVAIGNEIKQLISKIRSNA